MLFNLYNFTPHYLSASDGVFIEEYLRTEDEEYAISEPVFPTIPTTISTPVWDEPTRQACTDATAVK